MSELIYEKLAALLADTNAITKDRMNMSQKYSFRGIDDVYNALHPLLAKHEVVIVPCEIVSHEREERQTIPKFDNQKPTTLMFSILRMRYRAYAKDGSSIDLETIGEGMDSGDKASNKAMSAAYKYALFQLLCIPTEAVDSETDNHEVEPKGKPANKSTAKKQPSKKKEASDSVIKPVIERFQEAYGQNDLDRIEKGISKVKDPESGFNESEISEALGCAYHLAFMSISVNRTKERFDHWKKAWEADAAKVANAKKIADEIAKCNKEFGSGD